MTAGNTTEFAAIHMETPDDAYSATCPKFCARPDLAAGGIVYSALCAVMILLVGFKVTTGDLTTRETGTRAASVTTQPCSDPIVTEAAFHAWARRLRDKHNIGS